MTNAIKNVLAAAVFLGGVLLIIGWPALAGVPKGYHVAFDPALAINGATLVAVGVYTYLTYGLLRHAQHAAEKERCRRRDALATALLVELVTIEDRLRFLYSAPIDDYSASLDHPILQNAVHNIDVFDKDIAYAIVRFAQNLSRSAASAKESLKYTRDGITVRSGVKEQNRIAFVLELLSRLQALLRPLAPEVTAEWLTFPHERVDLLPLPSSAFADIPERLYGESATTDSETQAKPLGGSNDAADPTRAAT